ncbi:hypothetical protein Dsin_013884 [Dipteronia sinensis]|uniref:Uncharacterized protein n=1 Tax=Dipteronia sinensis TaxID=43782 RepID=A0AAE0AM18_9ROSI|nr:hypothetical protein Dsin_013884 [Dipteronia sinensis]
MEVERLEFVINKLGHISEKQEKLIQFYETRAQNLTMAYFIFQGLILVSVSLHSSSSNNLNQCHDWWVPCTVSLSTSLIFFIVFLDYVTRFYNTQYQLDLNYMEQQIINKQIHETTRSSSISLLSSDHHRTMKVTSKPYCEELKPDVVQLFKRKVYITVTLSALIGFAVVVLFACHSFLCNDGFEGSLVVSSATSQFLSS